MTSKKRFCLKLIHCGNVNIANDGDKEEKNLFFMPMGLLALAEVLTQLDVDIEVIHSDLEAGQSIEQILDFSRVDAVGFDLHWINQALVVLDTAELIKKIKPGVFIFLGGFSASLFAEEIVSGYSQVDAVIRGDAEVPIVELCRALQREAPLQPVQNLVWKDKQERLYVNPFTYTATAGEMDKLDFTAFHLVRHFDVYKMASQYWTTFPQWSDSRMFLLEVGRGCQYACTFCGGNCDAQYRMNKRKKTLVRSIAAVLSTVKKAVSSGFDTFYTCLEWDHSQEWYLRMFNRVREENLRINWVYGCWGLPSPTLVDALAANFQQAIIEISPETANVRLREQNKDKRICYTNEQLEQLLDYAEKTGNVKIHLYFGYYLAGDTKTTIWETLAYILELLARYPRLLIAEYSNFSTDPGSLFFFYPERYDIDVKVRGFSDYVRHLQRNYLEKKVKRADLTLFKPKQVSRAEDREIHRKIRLLHSLFSFYGKFVSHVLRETGGGERLLSFLEGAEITINADDTFSQAEIKKSLLGFCGKTGILDENLLRLIHSEDKKYKPYQKSILSNPRLGMDYEGENKTWEEKGVMMNLQTSNTRADEETLHGIEFDI
jgi:radical SAM superfamily enzyme YgiQ (UPF0313 family)